MKVTDIIPGKFYIKKSWNIRFVISNDDDTVRYVWFNTDGGTANIVEHCSTAHFARWAERQTTPEETAKIDLEKSAKEVSGNIFNRFIDTHLIEELERRGYSVTPK